MASHAGTDREIYLRGVESLLDGNPAEAVERLGAVPAAARPQEHQVALAKAYLELGRGEEALACLDDVLRAPPPDAGFRAYLEILRAQADAHAGRGEAAQARLAGVAGTDARLERAAHALRRRIRAGTTPLVRL